MTRKTRAYLSTRSIRKGGREVNGSRAALCRSFIGARDFIIKSPALARGEEEQKRALCGLTNVDARGVE